MIYIIDTEAERIACDGACKAQEDIDLVLEFNALMRVHRETVAILNDDEPYYTARRASVPIMERKP